MQVKPKKVQVDLKRNKRFWEQIRIVAPWLDVRFSAVRQWKAILMQ